MPSKRTLDHTPTKPNNDPAEKPGPEELRAKFQAIDAKFKELEENFHLYPKSQKEKETRRLMDDLFSALLLAQEAKLDQKTIRGLLRQTYQIHGQSPFIRRLQEWPEGYPGDFRTIEMLVRGEGAGDLKTLNGQIGRLALESDIAQQHREKLKIQSELIAQACSKHPQSTIISLGCGSAREMLKNLPNIIQTGMQIILVDSDPKALKAASKNLQPLGDNLTLVNLNIMRYKTLIKRLLSVNKNEVSLIYLGGLLDYFKEKPSKLLIKALSTEILSSGGTIMFTNLAEKNPYQPWIEILANWVIIMRSRIEMLELLQATGLAQSQQTLNRDPTGLTWLAQASKN